MDLYTLYHRSVETWADRVNAVREDQWEDPTPCREWSVRELTNHVAGEDRWTVPLVRGSTIAAVGTALDGDLLGEDPIGEALAAAAEATTAVAEVLPGGPPGGTVHLSYGEERMEEYLHQLAADHLVHGWDLAVATGGDPRLDPALVHEVKDWFAEREELYRQAGAIGARTAAAASDAQAELLAGFGRDPAWGPHHAAVARLSAAFGSGDVEAIMAALTPDCVFESTAPPDGERIVGADAVRSVWDTVFDGTSEARFEEEDLFVAGDRGVLCWRYSWTGPDGESGHVRGVDVLRMRDGRVCEKRSYVKG
jgi:uncharacterized protein (TIGR03086 family)